ncbi:MAG: hypothetical protein Terrestrivirus4_71 [Terrestrivirus sp.]|uniref:Uncharacterized protein n=1 Tax=Terrestrivirus sp. TaxID=2487775 RepID=A0A3G4ZQZ5_9VIRU|nr:MAG: hypothetical protein Terrestrivirus4_71 [Terrestrivirus sp.]
MRDISIKNQFIYHPFITTKTISFCTIYINIYIMDLLTVVKKGMYFCPAYKHYGQKTNVVCDRCNKQNLKACIGYDNKDLCLKCVDNLLELEQLIPLDPIEPYMPSVPYKTPIPPMIPILPISPIRPSYTPRKWGMNSYELTKSWKSEHEINNIKKAYETPELWPSELAKEK